MISGVTDTVIQCAAGTGAACTRVGAFHEALDAIGIATLNIVQLSSVVPRDWGVRIVDRIAPAVAGGGSPVFGDRIFGVLSVAHAFGEHDRISCAAALSWGVLPDQAGGYMAEGAGPSESVAEEQARAVLVDLQRTDGRAGWAEGTVSAGTSAERGQFVCAAAFAAYAAVPW